MATINAPTLQDTQYSGDCPLAPAHGVITLAAAQINDVVRLCRLYAGTKIHDSYMVNAALGAGSQVSLGFQYVNGEAGGSATALIPATATNAAGKTRSPAAPITLEYDAYLTATVTGAAATGKIDAVAFFEFKGTK